MITKQALAVMLDEMGVTRDELRIGSEVWNGARKIAVMRIRQIDEVDAFEQNENAS